MRYTIKTRLTETKLLVMFTLHFLGPEALLHRQNGEKSVHIPIDLDFIEDFSAQDFDSATQVMKISPTNRSHHGIEEL